MAGNHRRIFLHGFVPGHLTRPRRIQRIFSGNQVVGLESAGGHVGDGQGNIHRDRQAFLPGQRQIRNRIPRFIDNFQTVLKPPDLAGAGDSENRRAAEDHAGSTPGHGVEDHDREHLRAGDRNLCREAPCHFIGDALGCVAAELFELEFVPVGRVAALRVLVVIHAIQKCDPCLAELVLRVVLPSAQQAVGGEKLGHLQGVLARQILRPDVGPRTLDVRPRGWKLALQRRQVRGFGHLREIAIKGGELQRVSMLLVPSADVEDQVFVGNVKIASPVHHAGMRC